MPPRILQAIAPDDRNRLLRAKVAQAVLDAFPSFDAIPALFTHLREDLEGQYPELQRLAEDGQKRPLTLWGHHQEVPLLVLANTLADKGLRPEIRGASGRRFLFGILLECLAAEPGLANVEGLRNVATGLRIDLETIQKNPTSITGLPDATTPLELANWLSDEANTLAGYSKSFRQGWNNKVAPAFRKALAAPARDIDAADDDADEAQEPFVLTDLPEGAVAYGWIPEGLDDEDLPSATPLAEVESDRLQPAAWAPLSAYATASPTVLTEAEIANEIAGLLGQADEDALRAWDACARALVACTATKASHLRLLKWGDSDGPAAQRYPGVIHPTCEWLIRPVPTRAAAEGSEDDSAGSLVFIPIPPSLARRLKAVAVTRATDHHVFPELDAAATGRAGRSRESTAFRRTLLSRLMRSEPLGITAAQWVAGETLGLDAAPLAYDAYLADRFAQIVERITFPWFGDKPGGTRTYRPDHRLGSRRIPELATVRAFFTSLRTPPDGDDIVARLRAHVRNLVHGFVAFSGHRPNDSLGQLRIGDFGITAPVAILADKKVAPEWRARPVVVPTSWNGAFVQFLLLLEEAARSLTNTRLSDAAQRALSGEGPVFLAVESADSVRPFDLEAYLEGLPPELREVPNFARQLLNARLMGRVPEPLRVGQMGWHGTRAGAWAEESPWSVLSASETLEPVLEQVLREVGWRPWADRNTSGPAILGQPGWLDWVERERAHLREFRDSVRTARERTEERHAAIAARMSSQIASLIAVRKPGLRMERLPGEAAARLVPAVEGGHAPVGMSASDYRWLTWALSGGDRRSQEALVARNLIARLFEDARSRGVIEGPIPRRVALHWPNVPGPFAPGSARALRDAHLLDRVLLADDSPLTEAARCAVAVLLWGSYADVDTVLLAMAPGARMHSLRDDKGVLLLEPPKAGIFGQRRERPGKGDGASHVGCLAFHGLAALHLLRWHRQGPRDLPSEEELERDVHTALPAGCRPRTPVGTIRQIEALARSCNRLRMDGLARLVGTGGVRPVSVGLDRIVAARERRPLPARGADPTPAQSEELPVTRRTPEERRLLKTLYEALDRAREGVASGAMREGRARAELRRTLRAWTKRAELSPQPVDLVARYALALLTRGGSRREHLALSSIKTYVQHMAAPFVRHMPANPLQRPVAEWQSCYESVVVQTRQSFRLERALALQRFHGVLHREFTMPGVDFARILARAGAPLRAVDAGFLTDAELQALLSVLDRDVAISMASGSQADIHNARARALATRLAAEGALRTSEAFGLQRRDCDVSPSGARVHICQSRVQRLKTVRARRRVSLEPIHASCGREHLEDWLHEIDLPSPRGAKRSQTLLSPPGQDSVLPLKEAAIASIGDVIRWATGELDGHFYWLRKTGVHRRLDALQGELQGSLWPARDVLAEIGHASLLTTLGHYIHDPVVPFRRWFASPLSAASAPRIAAAIGQSLSVVTRASEGARLSRHPARVGARIADLLREKGPVAPYVSGKVTTLPSEEASTPSGRLLLREVDRLLASLAAGWPPCDVARAHRLNRGQTTRLVDAVRRLEEEFGVALGEGPIPGHVCIGQVRRLKQHRWTSALLDEAAAPTLAGMADRWLPFARLNSRSGGFTGTRDEWRRWYEAIPLLASLDWETGFIAGSTLQVRRLTSTSQGKGPHRLLRWALLVAWLQRGLGE